MLALAAVVSGAPAVAAEAGGERAAAFALPEPTGRYDVGTLEMRLVDEERLTGGRAREVMVSLWYPARHRPGRAPVPYLNAELAGHYDRNAAMLGLEPGDVDFASAETHAQDRAPVFPGRAERPVVLYSPGGGNPRAFGTTLVEELASRGYIVVAMDHLGQAPIRFPDRFELPADSPDMAAAMRERVADVRFTLDQLELLADGGNPDAGGNRLPRGLGAAMDLSHTGMFGHSMGGFASAETMLDEPRIDAGINLDGSMNPPYGEAAERGVDRPFMLFGAGVSGPADEPHNHLYAPEWASFWHNSTGWRRDLYLADGEHMSFADLQTFLPQIDAQIPLDEALMASLGTVDPARSLAVQRAYVTAFFDQHLRGRHQPLLDADSPAYPEVTFVE
ncbi:alpha/beta hydrolase family protein [Allonocardiopsis opalescens]|uniref:Putative dienelactone hydrolase n=1 Tax=Allonocardiopsis opalescens TaxID=1144618 RepID=A0A2T0Q391_9ACTN|nr:hypothetical protein [Allonocardiopsis opalescens]PRX98138.1 putative dienelactone hydrolase [Allonocardiopsis opalescens]